MSTDRGGTWRGGWVHVAVLAVALFPVALLGCSATTDPVSPAAFTVSPGAAATGVGSPGAVASSSATGATTCAAAAGNSWLDFQADGQTRKALLHVPAGVSGATRVPAIVALHGYSSKAEEFATYAGLSSKADSAGFFVVYPQALGAVPEWQLTDVPSDHPENRASDRAFIAGVVDRLAASSCVDPGRIFLLGHSQGGGMTADMSCDLAGRIAGIGLISPVRIRPLCTSGKAIPVVAFHALDDAVLPYAGGQVQGAPSSYPRQMRVDDWIAELAKRNGCAADPAKATLGDGSVESDWQGCGAPTRFFRLPSGGHAWAPTTTDRLWAFLSSLPARSS